MKSKYIITLLFIILLWIGVWTIYSLSIWESLKLAENMLRLWNSFEIKDTFYFFRHIQSIIIWLVIWGLFLLAPKKYITNQSVILTFFWISLILILLSLFNGIWYSISWETWRVILFWVTFNPIYLYIIWSILLLTSFLSKKWFLLRQFKFTTKFFQLIVSLPEFYLKIPIYVKYLILQILVSIPVIVINDFSNLILVWGISFFIFLFSKETSKIKYIFMTFFMIVWIVSITSINKYDYIYKRIAYCNILDNNWKENVEKKWNNVVCQFIKKTTLAIEKWWITWVWYKNWKLSKEIPDVMTDFNFSWITEEFWKIWIWVVLLLYAILFFIILKKDIKVKNEENLLVVWLCSYLLLTTFFHIWGNLWLTPFASFNLPYMSYWSSQLISYIITMSLILKLKE